MRPKGMLLVIYHCEIISTVREREAGGMLFSSTKSITNISEELAESLRCVMCDAALCNLVILTDDSKELSLFPSLRR
jgi:hypothetical protein